MPKNRITGNNLPNESKQKNMIDKIIDFIKEYKNNSHYGSEHTCDTIISNIRRIRVEHNKIKLGATPYTETLKGGVDFKMPKEDKETINKSFNTFQEQIREHKKARAKARTLDAIKEAGEIMEKILFHSKKETPSDEFSYSELFMLREKIRIDIGSLRSDLKMCIFMDNKEEIAKLELKAKKIVFKKIKRKMKNAKI